MSKGIVEFPVLYKKNKKGKLQQWQVCVHKNMYYTVEGLVGGKLTPAKPTVVIRWSRGRSPEKVAYDKAAALVTKKKSLGYAEAGEDSIEFFSPMLAFDVSKYEDLLFTVPTYVQPKLDGLRCVSFSNILQSRNGKIFVSCPHLHREDKTILDGELYNHALKEDFNAIISLTRKKNLDAEMLKNSKEWIQFHVYDMPGPEVFSERYEKLVDHFYEHKLQEKGYVLVPTKPVKSLQELEEAHEEFLNAGYEGTIVRLDLGGYENSRSKQLLKKKDWVDEEFTITGWEEGVGNRSNTIGKFYLEKDGIKFESNVKGDFKYLTDLWKDINANPDQYKGLSATVKYFRRTPAGVPRFPIIIKLGRELYE